MMMALSPTTTILLILLLDRCWAAKGAQSSPCLKQCVCKWKGGKESVTCHQAGMTQIPPIGLDTTVQVLDLSGNPLGQLGADEFSKLGLTNLQRIILQRCSLRQVNAAALSGLTNLIELDLSHNALTSIPGEAFQRVPELRELKLNGNPLLRLVSLSLIAASKLVRLELANCQLIHIEPKAFQGLELLEWLRLEGNLIEFIPPATLGSLRSLRGIELHHNPWNCTCPLRPLRSWLSARNMPFSIPPLCLSPVRLRGQSWNRLSLDELACPPQIQVAEGNVTVEAGQPVTLTCQVSSTPETVVTWLFAGKPIVNSSTAENVTNGPPEGTASPAQQLYYLREVKADKSNRSSHLILAAAREQDSGSYACQASNRADTVTGNITLVVRAGSAGSASGDGSMMMSRGLIAGVLLAVFAILIGVLLFCCMCSLKRARLHSSLRNRRPSTVLSASSANGLLLGSSKMAQEQLDPLFQSSGSSAHPRSNGVAGKPASLLPVVTGQPDSRMEKQWLVLDSGAQQKKAEEPQPDSPKEPTSDSSSVVDGHRTIAMYNNNKVTFSAEEEDKVSPSASSTASDGLRPSSAGLLGPPAGHHYPDVVEASGAADYAARIHQDERRRRTAAAVRFRQPARRLPSLTHQRRRLSDWELSGGGDPLEEEPYGLDSPSSQDPFSYDSELEQVAGQRRRRCSEDNLSYGLADEEEEEDFNFLRRYAYHTRQLNRFLQEYRSLQKRLSTMQDTTWNHHHHREEEGLDSPDSSSRPPPSRATYEPRRMPLRPILKNRLVQQPARRWSEDEGGTRDLSTTTIEETYYG